MRIEKHNSLLVADKVVSQLQNNFSNHPDVRYVNQEAWSNCREQGYYLRSLCEDVHNDRVVLVAECRNSDQIVLLFGTPHGSDFDLTTNGATERVYQEQKLYVSTAQQAAKFIHDYFTLAFGELQEDKSVKGNLQAWKRANNVHD